MCREACPMIRAEIAQARYDAAVSVEVDEAMADDSRWQPIIDGPCCCGSDGGNRSWRVDTSSEGGVLVARRTCECCGATEEAGLNDPE